MNFSRPFHNAFKNFNHTLTQVYNDKNLIKARIQVVASCANSRKSRDSFQLCMDANLRLKAQGALGKIELCSSMYSSSSRMSLSESL